MESAPRRSLSPPTLAVLIILGWALLIGFSICYFGQADTLSFLLVLGVAAVAGGLLDIVLHLAKSILPGGRIQSPATFTIPLIYLALLQLCVVFALSGSSSLVAPNDALQVLGVWQLPFVWMPMLVVHFCSLAIVAVRAR